MKKVQILAINALIVTLSLVCGTTFAYTVKQKPKAGYVGLQFGYGNTHYTADCCPGGVDYTMVGSVENKGIAGRLYGGYEFNKNFAIEAGMTFFSKTEFNDINMPGYYPFNISFNQNVLDLLGKATLPLQYNIDLYAKGGIADVIRNNYELSSGGQEIQCSDQYTKVVPVVGAGVDYGFNDHVFADLSYMRYFGSDDFKPIDFFGIGVVYRF